MATETPPRAAPRRGVSFGAIGWRVAVGVALVLATFNPSGVSYAHWAFGDAQAQLSVLVLAGITLLIGWSDIRRALSGQADVDDVDD